MPNWTTNTITFENKEIGKKYLDAEDNFDFNLIIPQPKVKDDCPEDCLATSESYIEEDVERPWFNWYNWNRQFWGTKWNACDTVVFDNEDNSITIQFDTAWVAPIPVFEKICKDNPNEQIDFCCLDEDCEYDEFDEPIYYRFTNGSDGVLEEEID